MRFAKMPDEPEEVAPVPTPSSVLHPAPSTRQAPPPPPIVSEDSSSSASESESSAGDSDQERQQRLVVLQEQVRAKVFKILTPSTTTKIFPIANMIK